MDYVYFVTQIAWSGMFQIINRLDGLPVLEGADGGKSLRPVEFTDAERAAEFCAFQNEKDSFGNV